MKLLKVQWIILIAAMAMNACSDDDKDSKLVYTATLNGSNEVPPVTTSASGTATFTVDGDKLIYSITVSSIDSVTAAHIHKNIAGQNTPSPYLGLFGGPVKGIGFSGELVRDTVDLPSNFIELADSDSLYVNVHTRQRPTGEIRGQLHKHD